LTSSQITYCSLALSGSERDDHKDLLAIMLAQQKVEDEALTDKEVLDEVIMFHVVSPLSAIRTDDQLTEVNQAYPICRVGWSGDHHEFAFIHRVHARSAQRCASEGV
jgi:hypothetical protein